MSGLKWDRENRRKKIAKQGSEYVGGEETAAVPRSAEALRSGKTGAGAPPRPVPRKLAPQRLVKVESVQKKNVLKNRPQKSLKRFKETRDGKIRAIRAQ